MLKTGDKIIITVGIVILIIGIFWLSDTGERRVIEGKVTDIDFEKAYLEEYTELVINNEKIVLKGWYSIKLNSYVRLELKTRVIGSAYDLLKIDYLNGPSDKIITTNIEYKSTFLSNNTTEEKQVRFPFLYNLVCRRIDKLETLKEWCFV